MPDCCVVSASPKETVTSRLNQLSSIAVDILQGCAYAHRRITGSCPDATKESEPVGIEAELDVILSRLCLARDYLNTVCGTIN